MTTLVDAIEKKFEMLTEPCNDLQHVTLYGSPNSLWKKRFYTANGSLCLPPVLVMDNSGVSALGDLDRLSRMCGHVTELDLCNNHLDDWPSLLQLLGRMPRLRWLNLGINPNLRPPETPLAPLPPMPQLATLVLNQLPLTWPLLAALLSAAPNVTELYLCNNSLSAPDRCHLDGGYPRVQQLFFNGNRIQLEDWAGLADWFPRLEKLTLIGNAVRVLPDGPELLGGLKSLNLSENAIANWAELEKLNKFEGLADLRILDVELARGVSKADFRSEAVARLPHVTLLNGAPVSDEERSTAERAFIRRYMNSAEADRPSQLLDTLEAKHGRLDELAQVSLKPADSVNLVLRYGAQSHTSAVPTGQTVRDLKQLMCSKFGLEPAKVNLYYVDQGMVGAFGPDLLNLPGRAFHSYRPEDGDELILRDRN